MKILTLAAVAASALTLAACGQAAEGTKEPAKTAATESKSADAMPMDGMAMADAGAKADAVHSTTGTVQSVSGATVTLAHEPVKTLNWPSMTMGFEAEDPSMMQGVKPGDRVAFSFRQADGKYVLTRIDPAR